MSRLLRRLDVVARGKDPLLADGRGELPLSGLLARARTIAARLEGRGVRTVAIALPNGVEWLAADLGTLLAGAVAVPIPDFFSPAQQAHVLDATGADLWLGNGAPDSARPAGAIAGIPAWALSGGDRRWARGTSKVTFTSGTTGTPKGVMLGEETLLAVADALVARTAGAGVTRHLCALPLAVLLENVAGCYAPLLAGADVVLPPPETVGLGPGFGDFRPDRLAAALVAHRADSVILLPQLLAGFTAWLAAARQPVPPLRLLAVGGAPVPPGLQQQAQGLGLPVVQGYGLSEFGSVVALQVPGDTTAGHCGLPLEHQAVRLSPTGELEIRGPRFLGYLGHPAPTGDTWFPTGDRAEIGADGSLRILGRSDHVIVTPMGRNVSPEWVETVLLDDGPLAQAVVVGPPLTALVHAPADVDVAMLEQHIERANARLPAYARVARWIRLATPLGATAGELTPNGRPRRALLGDRYLRADAPKAAPSTPPRATQELH